jgi:hypothetical protein
MKTCLHSLFVALLASVLSCGGGGTLQDCAPPEELPDRSYPYKVDGRFTYWDEECEMDGYEWGQVTPVVGMYGNMRVAFEEGYLYVLNDWHLNQDAAICADCFNLFKLVVNGDAYDIRVYGDQHITVLENGADISDEAEGATSFMPTPDFPGIPHSIFEFRIPIWLPDGGDFSMKEADPANGSTGRTEGELTDEPTIIKGTIGKDGTVTLEGVVDAPIITSLQPNNADPSDSIVVHGDNLGEESGSVLVGGMSAVVDLWTATAVQIEVPDLGQGPQPLRLVVAGEETNRLTLWVACKGECAPSQECGNDGCGGRCGVCTDGACNDATGLCECMGSCFGRECGDDGCGASCGSCAPGQPCSQGLCACQPSCEGKSCGADGCGGTCGTCPSGSTCSGGDCICQPYCGANNCGDDGCGGSCGSCQNGEPCVDGHCVCAPDCAGKSCGNDGCGGLCGTCTAGNMCTDGACECQPDCGGLNCGDNGCGGICGVCPAEQMCQAGACVCKPKCDGKECGDDACGGSCGECLAGTHCEKNDTCAPD